MLRKGENGTFKGGWGSLGVSGDRSVGLFINIGGNNKFEGSDQSIGSSRKPKSLGMFINVGGNNDYRFQKLSNARLQFPQSPKEWSSALFLEIGENSHYPEDVDEFKRGNDRVWGIEKHSLGISTQLFSPNSIETLFDKFHQTPQIPFPFDPLFGWMSNTSYRPLVYDSKTVQDIANEIGNADYDRRRQIYETLDLMRFKNRKIEYDLSYLLQNPASLETDAFNYAVLWALRNRDKVDLKEIKHALQEGAFQSEYTRKMAVSLVGTFWTKESIPIFKQIMLKDSAEEIRYYAALALALNLSNESVDAVKEGLESDSELVRYAISKGLEGSTNPSALELIVPLFNDQSFYVQRAAGLTAISLGDKKGIPIILDSLQYDTLDMGENYGSNIYVKLAAYLGVDFGIDKEAWIDWWDKVKNEFELPGSKKGDNPDK